MMVDLLKPRFRFIASAGALIAALAVGPAVAQDAPPPTVRMGTFTFTSPEVHISSGTTVSWVNGSNDTHTVTADDGAYDSGDVPSGESFSMSFDEPGRYQYYCVYHGGPGLQDMSGVVIVDE